MSVLNGSFRRIFLFVTAYCLSGISVSWAQDKPNPPPARDAKKSDAPKKEDDSNKPSPPATGTPATGTPAAGTPATGANTPSEGSNVQSDRHRFQLLTIEEKTGSLKEQIFRSKAKLMLLQESLLQGAISTSKVVLVHDNRMGSSFYLRSISYTLSGNPVFAKTDYEGSLNKASARKFAAFTNTLQPGRYTLSVELVFRGNGLGVFSYLKRYRFRVRSSYTFKALEGKSMEISVVAFEKNPLVTELIDRPSVQYDVKIRDITAKRKDAPKAEAK